jgi:hypothetical protein
LVIDFHNFSFFHLFFVRRQYRRSCLRETNSNLTEELDFLDEFASENPKNYQLWYHRRAIIEMSQDPSREFDFTEEVFDTDAKNYHAWAHRFVSLISILVFNNF